MGRPSNSSPENCGALERSWDVNLAYTGAGAANIVGVKTKGVASVTRQGVGLYTVFFQDIGGAVAGFRGVTHTAATVTPQIWKVVPASLSRTAKSIQIECWNVASAALADPPASSLVDLCFQWFDNV